MNKRANAAAQTERGAVSFCARCRIITCNAYVIGLPLGRPPGWPGGYVGEFKGMEWVPCPWAGGNSRDCFRINELGWGNSQHCWIMVSNTGISREHLRPCTEGENSNRARCAVSIVSPGRVALRQPYSSYYSRLESNLFICKLRAWFVSRLTTFKQGIGRQSVDCRPTVRAVFYSN